MASHIESVTIFKPPRRTACSQIMLMSMRSQRMRPGLSSLKDLRSKEPIEGLSSLPIKN